jgi:cell division protein FtsX
MSSFSSVQQQAGNRLQDNLVKTHVSLYVLTVSESLLCLFLLAAVFHSVVTDAILMAPQTSRNQGKPP